MAAIDLSTTYLGLRLTNPFMIGASPLADHLDTARRLEDAGCAAIVLHSLFEEQISKMLVWVEADKITPEQAAQRFLDGNPILVWYLIGDLTTGLQKPPSLQ